MALIKAVNYDGLTSKQKQNLELGSHAVTIGRRGIQGDNNVEPLPKYIARKSDSLYQGANNTQICLGTDRPGEIGSGRGNETGAGTIDLVAGRLSSNIQQTIPLSKGVGAEGSALFSDPNLSRDASRVYISQKTDATANFNIAAGSGGDDGASAGIITKSDVNYTLARRAIKLVTRADKLDSHGGGVISLPPINLIAGNDDRKLDSIVKQKPLQKALKTLWERMNEIQGTLDWFMETQNLLNQEIAIHQHDDPMLQFLGASANYNPYSINGGQCPVSEPLRRAALKAQSEQTIARKDNIMGSLKLTLNDMSSTETFGVNDFGSNGVMTT